MHSPEIKKIVLASNNQGKLNELSAMLKPLDIAVLSQKDFAIESIEETGLSFIENAILKARHVSKSTGLPAIADDSGLCVDALHGAPGIYSARFAGENATDEMNNLKLLDALANIPVEDRAAHFRCALALVRHAEDPVPIISEGVWDGQILFELTGTQGFGYDPLFYVSELHKASAELSPMIKNKFSHRAKALRLLIERLQP